jgi:thioredoxin-related protein
MKIMSVGVLCLAILFLGTACGRTESPPPTTPTAAAEPAQWLTDFEAAKAQAHAGNKVLLMKFTGSDWCPPCMALEKQVFSKPEFAEYAAKNLVLLELDFPRRKELPAEQRAANTKLAQEYGIEGFPTVIVLDANAKPLGQFGYVPNLTAAKVIEVLEKARVGK